MFQIPELKYQYFLFLASSTYSASTSSRETTPESEYEYEDEDEQDEDDPDEDEDEFASNEMENQELEDKSTERLFKPLSRQLSDLDDSYRKFFTEFQNLESENGWKGLERNVEGLSGFVKISFPDLVGAESEENLVEPLREKGQFYR